MVHSIDKPVTVIVDDEIRATQAEKKPNKENRVFKHRLLFFTKIAPVRFPKIVNDE